MGDQVFFYGTLQTGFNRRSRAGVDELLTYVGRGSIGARLFDLGLYPVAVPAAEGRVWGEVFQVADSATVLAALDGIQGCRPAAPDSGLYTRVQVPVTLQDGRVSSAWVYFYNAPLGQACDIPSGDYLDHLRAR